MERIKVIISWCDKNYGASVDDERIGGSVIATHKTYEGVLEAIKDALVFHVEGYVLDGEEMPDWLVSGDYEFEYEHTVSAIIRRSEAYTSLSAIARVSGINIQQLNHYACDISKPRKEQRERIIHGIETLGKELLAIV